jgi:aldose 1-epimerase
MKSRSIGISRFGATSQGTAVERLILHRNDLTVAILTLGAAVQGVWLKGADHSLTVCSDDLSLYEGPLRHHGTLIGPVVNRISNASADIDGEFHRFDTGTGEPLLLHSGPAGTHRKIWSLAELSETAASLTLDLPNGEGGFPGRRRVTARYALGNAATLRLTVTVSTDSPTLINFANHSYWNLDGSDSFAGHQLMVNADRYLPASPVFTPTGEIAPVAGTEFDFRAPRALVPGKPALDNNFCLSDARRILTDVATLTGQSGIRLTLATTEPGLQVYDARQPVAPGHPAYQGVALEAQLWPDAPGRAGFPSIELAPGETYAPVTEWRFDRV